MFLEYLSSFHYSHIQEMTFHKSFKILENVFNKGISVHQRLHEVFLIVTE